MLKPKQELIEEELHEGIVRIYRKVLLEQGENPDEYMVKGDSGWIDLKQEDKEQVEGVEGKEEEEGEEIEK